MRSKRAKKIITNLPDFTAVQCLSKYGGAPELSRDGCWDWKGGQALPRCNGLGNARLEVLSRRLRLLQAQFDAHDTEGIVRSERDCHPIHRSGHGTASVLGTPELRLWDVHLQAKEAAPLQKGRDKELHLLP
jgi:hypothetical protein